MTPRQRVLAAINLERPDRPPWLEIGVAGNVFGRVIGEEVVVNSGFHSLPDTGEYRKYLSQAIRAAEALGLCGVPIKAWNPAFSDNKSAAGAKAHSREGLVRDMPTLQACLAAAPAVEDHAASRCAGVYQELMGRTGLFRPLLVGGVFSHAEASMGTAQFAIACHEQPELVERLCEWQGHRTVEMIDALLQHIEPDAILLADDIAFKTSTFISPDMLRRFVFPQYRRIAQRIQQTGLPMMLHSDGNLSDVLEDLIEIGVQSVHPLENLAMDIRQVKRDYAGRVCLMGNLDVDIIERGNPGEVRRATEQLLSDMAGPGYIFASGNSITQWAPVENVLAMAQAVRQATMP